jgi:hypothetical protein
VGRRAGIDRRDQGREPTRPTVAHYGYIKFPRDQDGVWRMEFYKKPFENLAETWIRHSFNECRAERTLLEASRVSD